MDNTLFQKQLYELMKKYPKEEDFVNMMNSSLRGAAEQIQAEQSMKDYADVIIELIKNGRGGEEATLQSFLAFWLALNEHGNWKDYYNDSRILNAIVALKIKDIPGESEKKTTDTLLIPKAEKTQRVLPEDIKERMLDLISKINTLQKAIDDKKEKTLDDKLKEQGI